MDLRDILHFTNLMWWYLSKLLCRFFITIIFLIIKNLFTKVALFYILTLQRIVFVRSWRLLVQRKKLLLRHSGQIYVSHGVNLLNLGIISIFVILATLTLKSFG